MSETIGTTIDVRMPQTSPPSGELALRIRGGDYHGRVVRIRASQCTVGSAPDCTLRLSGPGLRPLHCIILRGEAGVTVRRWSPDTQLNGRAFSDALLMAGDRLGIGPIELEVLDDSEITQHRRAEMGAGPMPVAELAGEIVSHLRRDLRRGQDDRQRKIQRQRLRKSRRHIKSLEAELERLQAAINSLTSEESSVASQPPEASTAQWEAERAAWDGERQSLLKQVEEKGQFADRLESEASELRKECLAAARQQSDHSQNTERLLQDRAAESAQLQSQCEDLERKFQAAQQAEALANARVSELQERIAALEAVAIQTSQNEASEALQSAQRQVHELFAEGERLREELHQANCALAAAQCRLSEQEAALTAFREMHQHAIAELDLECKTLQTQLADAQTKFDEQSGRLAELESQQIPLAVADHERIAELEAQLAFALAAKGELQATAEQSGAEWSQREQELTQRIECLERLAGSLEDELRNATSNPDKLQLEEERRQRAEQQLSETQRQWSEQRQLLEDQALSAHQQLQDMENQVASMRDALHGAHGQVRERDELLSQLRDEIREQLSNWQQERSQLLQAAEQRESQTEPQACPSLPAAPQQADVGISEPTEPTECQSAGDCDRPIVAEDHGVAEIGETPADLPYVAESIAPAEPLGNWQDPDAAAVEQSPLPSTGDETADSAQVEEAPSSNEREESAFSSGDTSTLAADAAVVETHGDEESRRDGLRTTASSQQPLTPGHSDDEESIEAYMARLLKRVRGDAVADAFVIQQAALGPVPVVASAEPAGQTAESMQSAQAGSQEFLPRKTAPEQPADVAAMRELAVQSTRQAIDHSSQLRYQRNSLTTTLGACALMGLSVALYGWGFDTGNWLAWSGAGVCLLGAGYLTTRRMKLGRAAKNGLRAGR